MAVPYQPQNVTAQQADGNVLISWTGALLATSYSVRRSTDGTNFTEIGTTANGQYIDLLPGIGSKFYYQVVAVNGSGDSVASTIVYSIPAPPGQLSLGELRLRGKQRADRVNSTFVTDEEWNFQIRQASYELYDLLITTYEKYSAGSLSSVIVNTNGSTQFYDLPNGINYLGGTYTGVSGTPAKSFYKMIGIDLGVNTSNNAWVTISSFNFVDRNNYVYPNSTSTIYGVYNMRAEVIGNQLMVIPTPAGNQQLRLWYAPILPGLLADTDLTVTGWNGFLQYVIARSAKYALDKEESDTTTLDAELNFLKTRIEQAAANRDEGGQTISNTRRDAIYGGGFGNDGGANGGW